MRNRVIFCGVAACVAWLQSGTAVADPADDTLGTSAWTRDYLASGYYGYPGYGTLGDLDPGYAASLGTLHGLPFPDTGGYGLHGLGWGGYGYSGYGLYGYGYPGYGYGTGAYDYPAGPYGESASARDADRRYIRQLEERIRKLEKASREPQPFYGGRSGQWVFSPSTGKQPAYQAPAAGYSGQSGNPWLDSLRKSQGEYPTYQPNYGASPAYRFGQ